MAEENNAPGFLSSIMSGIAGAIKGAFAGGTVGALAGGAIAGVVAVATGGVAAIPAAAMIGAALAGGLFATVGAMAGTVTEVVKTHQQAARPTAAELVKLGENSVKEGISFGLEMAKEQEKTQWRDKYVNEQAARAVQGSDKVH